jgi:predicted DNA-binding transcriptional regulator AlpA
MSIIELAQALFTLCKDKMNEPIDFNNLITLQAFAALCGTSRQTVYKLLKAKKAPRNGRFFGRVYFYLDEATTFAEEWKKTHMAALRCQTRIS